MSQIDAAFYFRLNNITVDRVAEIRMRLKQRRAFHRYIHPGLGHPSVSIGSAFPFLDSQLSRFWIHSILGVPEPKMG
jgi:hypothetical protein